MMLDASASMCVSVVCVHAVTGSKEYCNDAVLCKDTDVLRWHLRTAGKTKLVRNIHIDKREDLK